MVRKAAKQQRVAGLLEKLLDDLERWADQIVSWPQGEGELEVADAE